MLGAREIRRRGGEDKTAGRRRGKILPALALSGYGWDFRDQPGQEDQDRQGAIDKE